MDKQSFVMKDRVGLIPCGYKLKEKSPWWGRLAWRLLERLQLLQQEYQQTHEVYRVPSPPDLFDAIWKQIEGLQHVHRKPKEILIGPSTLSDILRQSELAEIMQPIQLNGEGYYDAQPFPIPVHVLPQMEGVIVL